MHSPVMPSGTIIGTNYTNTSVIYQWISESEFPEDEGIGNDLMPFQMAKRYFHFTDGKLRVKEPE